MAKYTQGWLLRRPRVWIDAEDDAFIIFHPANDVDGPYSITWLRHVFRETYDRNFPLPKAGCKVKCWIEL